MDSAVVSSETSDSGDTHYNAQVLCYYGSLVINLEMRGLRVTEREYYDVGGFFCHIFKQLATLSAA